MRVVPVVTLNEKKIVSALKRATRALAPDVVRIRYSLGEDWTGDPSIFFRVLLTDEASLEPICTRWSKRRRTRFETKSSLKTLVFTLITVTVVYPSRLNSNPKLGNNAWPLLKTCSNKPNI